MSGADEVAPDQPAIVQSDISGALLSFPVDEFVLETRSGEIGPKLQNLAAQAYPTSPNNRSIWTSETADEDSKTMLRFWKARGGFFERSYTLAMDQYNVTVDKMKKVAQERDILQDTVTNLARYIRNDLEREIGFEAATEDNVEQFLRGCQLDEQLVQDISQVFLSEAERRRQLQGIDGNENNDKARTEGKLIVETMTKVKKGKKKLLLAFKNVPQQVLRRQVAAGDH